MFKKFIWKVVEKWCGKRMTGTLLLITSSHGIRSAVPCLFPVLLRRVRYAVKIGN